MSAGSRSEPPPLPWTTRAPTVTIGAASSAYTAHGPIAYNITFADANFGASNLVSSDLTLNRTGTANGSIGVAGSGTSYTVTISNVTGSGTLAFTLIPGTGVDLAGNLAPGSGPSASFVVDNTPPTVSIAAPSATITNSAHGPISYTVTYADANFGSSTLSASNVTLNTTGTANGAVSVSGSGTTYTVSIGSITGNGTLGISIGADTAVDLAGNEAPASAASNTFIVYNTAPSVTIGAASSAYAANGTVSYTVTYADPYFTSSNLTAGDITLSTTGTATGSVSVTGSGTTYTVSISNLGGDGTIGFSIIAGTAGDQAGNTAGGRDQRHLHRGHLAAHHQHRQSLDGVDEYRTDHLHHRLRRRQLRLQHTLDR